MATYQVKPWFDEASFIFSKRLDYNEILELKKLAKSNKAVLLCVEKDENPLYVVCLVEFYENSIHVREAGGQIFKGRHEMVKSLIDLAKRAKAKDITACSPRPAWLKFLSKIAGGEMIDKRTLKVPVHGRL